MRSKGVGWLAVGLALGAACGGSHPAADAKAGTADAADVAVRGDAATADGSGAGYPRTNINAVWPGAGCGKGPPAELPTTIPGTSVGYKHYVVMGTGANLTDASLPAKAGPRTFWVRVPADYDPSHPYRVVYLGQGCGSYESANMDTYPLYREAEGGTEEAIYVALDIPEDGVNDDCYDNRDGPTSQEWEAFQLFEQVVDANYCTDLNRIYVAGYSTGGWLANMWGCYFAGWPTPPRKFAPQYHIRGQAAYSGAEPPTNPPCNGPVAALWIHDQNDNANPISGDIAALARVGRMNGCDTTYDNAAIQAPWHPEVPAIGNVCKTFTGCPADYPVVFCTTVGFGRTAGDQRFVPALTLFLDQLDPPAIPRVSDAGTDGTDAGSDGDEVGAEGGTGADGASDDQ